MPSPAAIKYQVSAERARVLLSAANDKRLRPMTNAQVQTYLHASLAAAVAGWDAYVHNLVEDYFSETADPLVPNFNAVHGIAHAAARIALERFKTPSWDNTRNLLAQYTGFDPYAEWIWPARHLGVAPVKERLDQILRVRHSFAHGFPLPSYSWTRSKNGNIRLNAKAVRFAHAFFRNLIIRTDRGMTRYITAAYGKHSLW